jgi:hypothetical protein
MADMHSLTVWQSWVIVGHKTVECSMLALEESEAFLEEEGRKVNCGRKTEEERKIRQGY